MCSDGSNSTITFDAGPNDSIIFSDWKSTAQLDAGFDPENPRRCHKPRAESDPGSNPKTPQYSHEQDSTLKTLGQMIVLH